MNIQTVTHNGISFLDIHNPQELEIKFLRKNYGFNPLNLEDYINKTQVPKIENYKDYTYIVLDFPTFDTGLRKDTDKKPALLPQLPLPHFSAGTHRKRILTSHVALFVGKDYLVVLHDERTPQIDEIFSLSQKTLRHREDLMGEGPVFLFYRLVDILVDSTLAVANELTSTIDYIDQQLAQNRSPHVVEDISTTRRNIVVFQTMIKPLLPIFGDLEKGNYKELNGAMTPFWSNIYDHLQKVWERLEDNKELIEGIAISNESILTFRTNEIVKFLTIITSVSFPFLIVNNLYSMNVVGLPFAQQPWIVWILFIVIFLGASLILVYFKIRNWL